ncbi:aspartyl protease family protein [Glaciecola sp. 1036]|uniref:aspartyl protease family protein n=1 Tax=Alteromonadaceae TaxID=72275 RepID=UPI003D077000
MKYLLILLALLYPWQINAAATKWVDFTLHNGHIYIPVTIEGIESHAILDSGAQLHGINKAFVGKNELELSKGPKIRVQGVHEVMKRTSYNQLKIELFGTEFLLDKVVESSLGHHSTGLLLGSGFFQPFIVQLDYPNKKIRILTRDTVDMDKVSNVNSTADRQRGMPIAEVLVNEKPFWFLVDTGSSGSILMERRYASQAGLLENIEGSTSSRGVNGFGTQDFATADVVGFGPYDIRDVKVRFPSEGEKTYLESQYSSTKSRIKGKKVVGIIGYDLFQHFIITLEYKEGRVHIALPKKD